MGKLRFQLLPVYTLLLISVLPYQGEAQSRVNILQADRAEGGIFEGQNIRKILGNVILQTDKMLMETDSVYQFVDRNLLMAFNAQIETENEMIWADTLLHNTVTEYSRLRGRVIIQSEQNTVFADSMDVDQQKELVLFNVPVRFEDEKGTLIAESGIYYQAVDSAVFRGNVQLADTTQYLEADSLFMNRSAELYELFGRVYADDYEDNVSFAGEYLYADSLGYRLLQTNAWFMEVKENNVVPDTTHLTESLIEITDQNEITTDIDYLGETQIDYLSEIQNFTLPLNEFQEAPPRLNETEPDTTHLFADRIEIFETDTLSKMDAIRDVQIWSAKFSAIADTVNYREDIEQFILRSNPILWQKNMQLTGPYIEINLEDDEIRFLRAFPRPIIVQEDSITGRFHQMTGDTLHAWFEEGDIQRIRVFNNSEIIFQLVDDEDQPDGLAEMMSAGPATMFFLEGELDFFKAEQNIDGSYLPEDPVVTERKLDNFRWDPDRKPEKPEPRRPRLPPVPDERPFEMPPRYANYLSEREI
jgi:lipopolysaccharide export system protein LptA